MYIRSEIHLLLIHIYPSDKYLLIRFHQFKNLFNLLLHRLKCIYPMNGKTSALHTTEPGHLPFGKLMNGDFQSSQHLLIRSFSYHIFCDKLVFQPVIQQVFCRNTTIEESLDFLYHPILQTLFQTAGDFITAGITVDTYSYHQRINRRQFPLRHRMFEIIGFNLNCTDGTLRSIYICAIVHMRTILRLQIHQHICQFFQRFTFEGTTKNRILRNW